MRSRHSQTFWVGIIFALSLLSSFAQAAPEPTTPVTPVDPKNLMEQAEKAMDRGDLAIAMNLYVQAAELNYLPAQVSIGELADMSQFYEAAVGWYLMAATQGDAAGQFHLAKMYAAGLGIDKDESKAAYWFRRSAAKNWLPAVRVIASAYQTGGLGFKVDLEQAKSWDNKASRLEVIERKTADEKLTALAAAKKKLQEEEAAKKINITK